MNIWQVQSFCDLDSHRTAIKTSELAHRKTLFSFKIPISDSHYNQNNSFHLTSIRCKLRHRCHNYTRGTTTKTRKFSLPCKILTELRNSPSKNIPFFQNAADSQFLMNTVIRSISTLFTNCKHRRQYYIGIIQILELRIF